MNSIPTDAWRHRGSSIVFHRAALGPLIENNKGVSLRQALSWQDALPAQTPSRGDSILIFGLETMLQTLSPEEADEFLQGRVRNLIVRLQRVWPDCGLIFGFAIAPQAFVENVFDEEVLFTRQDQEKIRLSWGLWDGSANMNMQRIIRLEDGKEKTIGYHVARIS